MPSLFAGKLHAVLCRNWKSRIKGRDLYDLVWYIGQNTPCNLAHLKARMVQTGHWNVAQPLALPALLGLLEARFTQIDFEEARREVRPFLKDPEEIAIWSRDFFVGISQKLHA